MQYKALMLDVDGTLVPYDFTAVPSSVVAAAVKKAQEKVTVCVVTGREYSFIQDILKTLKIKKGFAVVNNGANVIEIGTEKELYEQAIDRIDAEYIIKVFQEAGIEFYIKQNYLDRTFLNGPFQLDQTFEKAYMFFSPQGYTEDTIDTVIKKLSHLSQITPYKTHHKDPEKFGLDISHIKATKLHGVEIIMKKLQLKREEVIGVGDSYNDFSLLMACGLKVAMGNAIDELKAIADYIAPSVTEDGVADVIKKYIL